MTNGRSGCQWHWKCQLLRQATKHLCPDLPACPACPAAWLSANPTMHPPEPSPQRCTSLAGAPMSARVQAQPLHTNENHAGRWQQSAGQPGRRQRAVTWSARHQTGKRTERGRCRMNQAAPAVVAYHLNLINDRHIHPARHADHLHGAGGVLSPRQLPPLLACTPAGRGGAGRQADRRAGGRG